MKKSQHPPKPSLHLLLRQSGFVRVLHQRYPTLTRQELLICVLLRDGLSSGEMASKLHCSIRTVENHRYKIRKKIGLRTSEDLSLMMVLMPSREEKR